MQHAILPIDADGNLRNQTGSADKHGNICLPSEMQGHVLPVRIEQLSPPGQPSMCTWSELADDIVSLMARHLHTTGAAFLLGQAPLLLILLSIALLLLLL